MYNFYMSENDTDHSLSFGVDSKTYSAEVTFRGLKPNTQRGEQQIKNILQEQINRPEPVSVIIQHGNMSVIFPEDYLDTARLDDVTQTLRTREQIGGTTIINPNGIQTEAHDIRERLVNNALAALKTPGSTLTIRRKIENDG